MEIVKRVSFGITMGSLFLFIVLEILSRPGVNYSADYELIAYGALLLDGMIMIMSAAVFFLGDQVKLKSSSDQSKGETHA